MTTRKPFQQLALAHDLARLGRINDWTSELEPCELDGVPMPQLVLTRRTERLILAWNRDDRLEFPAIARYSWNDRPVTDQVNGLGVERVRDILVVPTHPQTVQLVVAALWAIRVAIASGIGYGNAMAEARRALDHTVAQPDQPGRLELDALLGELVRGASPDNWPR